MWIMGGVFARFRASRWCSSSPGSGGCRGGCTSSTTSPHVRATSSRPSRSCRATISVRTCSSRSSTSPTPCTTPASASASRTSCGRRTTRTRCRAGRTPGRSSRRCSRGPDPRARAGRQRQRRPRLGTVSAHGSGPDHDGGAAMTDGGILGDLDVLDLSWGIAGPMTGMLLADHGARHSHRAAAAILRGRLGARGSGQAPCDVGSPRRCRSRRLPRARAPRRCRDRASGRVLRNGWGSTIPRSSPPTHGSCTARSRVTASREARGPSGLRRARRGADRSAVRESRGRRHDHRPAVGQVLPGYAAPEGCTIGAARAPCSAASRGSGLATFYNASVAINAALLAREITGKGQHVHTSMLQGALATTVGVATPSGPTAKASTRGSSTRAPKGLLPVRRRAVDAPLGTAPGVHPQRRRARPPRAWTRPDGASAARPCASRPRSRT